MNQRLINAVLDTIIRFRASNYPLKNVAKDIIKARRLNSHDRKTLLDLVFRWSREINLFCRFLIDSIPHSSSLSVQKKDALFITILTDTCQDKALPLKYKAWLEEISDKRYLLSLGPLVSGILQRDYGDDAFLIAKGLCARAKKYLALDQRYVSLADLSDALHHLAISCSPHPILPSALGLISALDPKLLPKEMQAHVWYMDPASQMVAELIKPKPHERVLDLCAGEGNKARYITMQPCVYVAVDIDEQRLKRARRNLSTRGIDFITADARTLNLEPQSFDWILLDAPCSGIGVIRRHFDVVHRLTKKDIENYIRLQHELLQTAMRLLKKGGKLIYATCSLNIAENDHQITRLSVENSQIMPVELADLVGGNTAICTSALIKNSFTFFPHIHDCDGFYCAALTK